MISIEQSTQINTLLTELASINIKMIRLSKKKSSKSKRVNNHRIWKAVALGFKGVQIAKQIQIIKAISKPKLPIGGIIHENGNECFLL